MTQFKGFETEKEAKEESKENGGMVCGKESKTKAKREYYQMAVSFGGLNEDKYPWCVQWSV